MNQDRRQFLRVAAAAAVSAGAGPSSPGAVAVTAGPGHHFFGYYDKSPWSPDGSCLLAHEVGFVGRQPRPGEPVTVGVVDPARAAFIALDQTPAWSWQQGAMLQWVGGGRSQVVYNSVSEGRYVAVLRDVGGGGSKTLPRPVYALSRDGKLAAGLDFARLHRLRPGYGYAELPEERPGRPAPDDVGVYVMDMGTGENRLIVSLAGLAALQPKPEFYHAEHWVNHLLLNPSGTELVFLHRWTAPGEPGWATRMVACRPDGSGLRPVIDGGMVSHFDWRDDRTILAWARVEGGGDGFRLFDTAGGPPERVGEGVLTQDGHCSYSPDRKWVLNDTYPDRDRRQTLMLYRPGDGRRVELGRFYLPPELHGPWRCDLHPRWDRTGTKVCIDSAHEGSRQMYVLDVSGVVGA